MRGKPIKSTKLHPRPPVVKIMFMEKTPPTHLLEKDHTHQPMEKIPPIQLLKGPHFLCQPTCVIDTMPPGHAH